LFEVSNIRVIKAILKTLILFVLDLFFKRSMGNNASRDL
jgi:hypothetical protein